MTDTIEWGDLILHDGNGECPEHARDVPCLISRGGREWRGYDSRAMGREWTWPFVTHYRLPADHPFYAKGEQPAEEPTCGGCRWWDRYDSDFALPDQGRCHFNPATPDGFGLCFEDSMACSKFTAKGAGK